MIYFVQPVEGGPVKIGHSRDLKTRIAGLESHYGKPLALLKTLPGGRPEERDLHTRFAHLRLGRTEQFRPAADLMAFIDKPLLIGANPDAVEAIPPVRADVTIRVDCETASVLRKVAALKGVSIAEYLRSVVLPIARRDLSSEAKKIVRGDKPE